MTGLLSRIPPRLRRWLAPRRLLAAAAALLLLIAAAAGLVLWSLPDVTPLKDRRTTLTIEVRDWQGKEHPFRLGPQNRHWTPLDAFPAEMRWAVIVAEDAGFYEHEGIDVTALREALKYNLEKKRLARGASTITQQLAKNVFLSREKSFWRKLREFLLARSMERELTKGRILELYLNVVELGPRVHGVGHGARHFFGKTAGALTPAECALLAAILPGPRVAFNPQLKPEKVRRRAARILNLLKGRGIIDEGQYARELAQLPVLLGLAAPPSLPLAETGDDTSETEVFESIPAPAGEDASHPPAAAPEADGPAQEPSPASR
jgi:monofunctional biosynthetic peptidoglycan transglycosylase